MWYAKTSTGGVFISYRRQDSQGFAGRLADDLTDQLGDEQIFRDDEIPEGEDFTEILGSALDTCRALIVVIGRDWLDTRDAAGERRLNQPDDWVRLEIEAALARDVWVLPVLVSGAAMPRPDELPPSLVALTNVQAFNLSDRRWDYDIERLMALLTNRIPALTAASSKKSAKSVNGERSSEIESTPLGTVIARVQEYLATAAGDNASKPRWGLTLFLSVIRRAVVLGIAALVAYFVLENYAPPAVRNFVYGFLGFVADLVRSVF